MELQRAESKEFLNDLVTRDQRMMGGIITIAILADSKKELDADSKTLRSVAQKHMCQLAILKYQQMDGLNTVLPIGVRKIHSFRTFTTESLAVFMPFKVQEIMDKGGIYFGENTISHNLILCNKANLLNQSAFLLGVPGSGKSFSAKELIAFLILNTDDDILICDPEGEYDPVVKAFGGEVITIAAGSKDHINALDMSEGYGDSGNPIIDKSQFVMSLFEQLDNTHKGITPIDRSIIDRCVSLIYDEAREQGFTPTLKSFRSILLRQPEPEARSLALKLELFTDGSLDAFAHETNVDMNNRILSYNIFNLGKQLKTIEDLFNAIDDEDIYAALKSESKEVWMFLIMRANDMKLKDIANELHMTTNEIYGRIYRFRKKINKKRKK
jgi:type IV secretory pathway VirB4 component